jgi:hypothetical protein
MFDEDDISVPDYITARMPAPSRTPVMLSIWEPPPVLNTPALADDADVRSLFTCAAPISPSPDPFDVGLPEKPYVQRLAWEAHTARSAGAQLFVGPRDDMHLPLWFLTFWEQCHEALDAKARWGRAHKAFLREVHSKRSDMPEHLGEIVAATEILFMTVGWKVSFISFDE